MKVEVVLTEADITQEFVEAMEARDVPEKFFFWSPRAAAAWRALTQDAALYGGLAATWHEIASSADGLARHFGGRAPVISFGAGDGARDLALMCALKAAGCECTYFPVDASQCLLEAACAAAEDEDIEAVGIKTDISSPVHLVYAADAADAPRLFLMAGNTLGAFDPLSEIRYIAQFIKPGDRLIIDTELYDPERTLALRAQPAARRFAWEFLGSMGIGEDDGEVRYDQKRDERRAGLHLITRYFRASRDVTAIVGGHSLALERGERMGLNFQYACTPEAFHWLLADHGGLTIAQEYRSPDGRFLTAVCRR
ncbi:MAG TPA: L-histidine N(alpha)-methyltransferase [Bryobacteraceae bacterium]|nr:L-histidine N(alpha)-methyltransferase [Bryobacteraceae bacterium]